MSQPGPPQRAKYKLHDVVAGRYRLEGMIGRGGAGSVYRASVLGMDQEVALKIMHDHDPSGVDRQRFEREARLAQQLRHKHAVQLLDMGYTAADRPYIIYELLPGCSLKTAMQGSTAFTEQRVAQIALQLLEVLGAAHEMGILHRDIKPANIFLCDGHRGDFIKLLDLGLGKGEDDHEPGGVPLTKPGHRLGTPRYISPEMARGERTVAAGDLYALGLVMAELLSGRPVVRGKAQIDLLMAHGTANEHVLDPAVHASVLAGPIQRALAKDLAVRYRNAMQMHADVRASLRAAVGGADDDDEEDDDHLNATVMLPSDADDGGGGDVAAAIAAATAKAEAEKSGRSSIIPQVPAIEARISIAPAPLPAEHRPPDPPAHPTPPPTASAPTEATPTQPVPSSGRGPALSWPLLIAMLFVLAAIAGAVGYFLGG